MQYKITKNLDDHTNYNGQIVTKTGEKIDGLDVVQEVNGLLTWLVSEDEIKEIPKENYYTRELENVKPNKYATIKITGENGSTKWMNVNADSKDAIIKWLTENY